MNSFIIDGLFCDAANITECGVAWCGVVCGVVWCVVWCGVVCGVVWLGVWCGVVWNFRMPGEQ